jgi:hypothetical protein
MPATADFPHLAPHSPRWLGGGRRSQIERIVRRRHEVAAENEHFLRRLTKDLRAIVELALPTPVLQRVDQSPLRLPGVANMAQRDRLA